MATINGTSLADTLTGTSSSDTINALDGNDIVNAGNGNDRVYGGNGNDTLNGGNGNDRLYGEDGDDDLSGGDGNDTLNGGNGTDTADYSSASSGVTLAFSDMDGNGIGGQNSYASAGGYGGDANGDSYVSIERFIGSGYQDYVGGGSIDMTFNLGAGNDVFDTNAAYNAIDTVDGGTGNDTIWGGGGNDVISGGADNDVLYGENDNDTLDGGLGNDRLYGGSGNDTLRASAGSDQLYGDSGNDTVIFNKTTVAGGTTTADGGSNTDTLRVELTSAEYTNAVRTELLAFQTFLASPLNAGLPFTFSTMGLTATNFETVQLVVDGIVTPITGANNPPVINTSSSTSSMSVAHSHSATGQVVASDANGDTLTYAVTTGPAHGTVSLNGATGQFTFSGADFVGTDSFTVQVSDGRGGTATHTVSVNLTNDGPAVDGSSTSDLTVGHGQAVNGSITGTDADGDSLSYSVQSGPAHGTITIDGQTGAYTYSAGDYVGADSFTLQVSDGHGGTVTKTVAVDLTNDGPAIDGSSTSELTVGHGQAVNGSISATDGDGDSLNYAVRTGPQHGTITIDAQTGAYTYSAGDYVGTDVFELAVSDGHGGVSTKLVTVNLTNENPVFQPASTASIILHHGEYASGTVSASDADGDGVTFSLASGPQQGSISIDTETGAFTYHAYSRYAGPDSFTIQALDGHSGVSLHTVDVGIWGVLDKITAASGINVDLMTDVGTGFTAEQLCWIIDVDGTGFNDVIKGDNQANVFNGFGGNDELRGLGGNDMLDGGMGDDKIYGDDGSDILYGGDGKDLLNGGAHDDVLIGGIGNDGFFGGGGHDRLEGGEGNDRLYGDGGNDIMIGGAGSDIMTGAGINNSGLKGANTYVWSLGDVVTSAGASNGLDHITDFGAGDRLDFSDMFDGTPAAVAYDMLQVTDTAAGLVISAEVGTGGALIDIVVLDNVHGLSLDDLFHTDQIIV